VLDEREKRAEREVLAPSRATTETILTLSSPLSLDTVSAYEGFPWVFFA